MKLATGCGFLGWRAHSRTSQIEAPVIRADVSALAVPLVSMLNQSLTSKDVSYCSEEMDRGYIGDSIFKAGSYGVLAPIVISGCVDLNFTAESHESNGCRCGLLGRSMCWNAVDFGCVPTTAQTVSSTGVISTSDSVACSRQTAPRKSILGRNTSGLRRKVA